MPPADAPDAEANLAQLQSPLHRSPPQSQGRLRVHSPSSLPVDHRALSPFSMDPERRCVTFMFREQAHIKARAHMRRSPDFFCHKRQPCYIRKQARAHAEVIEPNQIRAQQLQDEACLISNTRFYVKSLGASQTHVVPICIHGPRLIELAQTSILTIVTFTPGLLRYFFSGSVVHVRSLRTLLQCY